MQRQPRPTDAQAVSETKAVCAQAIRSYKEYADAGVSGFDAAFVRLTLTGDARYDQAVLLKNDSGEPRWLDIARSVSKQFPGRIAPDPGAPEYEVNSAGASQYPRLPGLDMSGRTGNAQSRPILRRIGSSVPTKTLMC